MSIKKKDLMSSAMKRTSEWISSQEVSSDVTVHIGEASFSLHKFPLLSKCGYIKKLISESSKPDSSSSEPTILNLQDIPGGSESFELAAKFCYGINFDMSTENIAMLRCAAEYLEMNEEHSIENLITRTETYLNEVALKSLSSSITVLHKCEDLCPVAERVKLVSRCVDAIALMTCQESQFCSPSGNGNGNGNEVVVQIKESVVDWWAEDLTVLRIDSFQRVLIAMMARGFKQYGLGPVLMLYAQKSLRGLEIFGKATKKIEPKQEHEKRVILETIVSLLPREKNAMSVSFLSMLLRASIYLETTVACRLDLEKRMGLQLPQAVLDDLLIPSYAFNGDHSLFDVETVQRILMNYLEFEVEGIRLSSSNNGNGDIVGDLERVGKLMENYLAEIASDRNVSLPKFIGLAELIPEQSRVTEDGMYRAVDIYLKAHPNMTDVERKKVCSLMDCQKLSREACAHAAQNDRLPVQTIVQVLYYEQQRLRGEVTNDTNPPAPPPPLAPAITVLPPKLSSYNDELSKLKRENQDLKLELLKMKMKLKEFEKEKEKEKKSSSTTTSVVSTNPNSPSSMDKPPLPRKSFMNSVGKKLGKLNPFGIPPYNARGRNKPPKDRRHSIS